MVVEPTGELQERLARMRGASPNGGEPEAQAPPDLPSTDDLDWFLFRSFPDCGVGPRMFAELVPVYEKALRDGATFDHELLFVRLLELSSTVGPDLVRSVARAAAERVLAEGFDTADAVAAIRFAIRALPADDTFLDEILTRDDLARFRFHWTLDFVLDERDLDEYLAMSYLREDDPDTRAVLERFPVPGARRETLRRFLSPDSCRRRIATGWEAWTIPEEREFLAASLEDKLPGISSGGGMVSPSSGEPTA